MKMPASKPVERTRPDQTPPNSALEIREPVAPGSGHPVIDADWMTRCLSENGVAAKVATLSAQPVGTGQMAHSVRFSLGYASDGAKGPATLIGKFPSPHERSRKSGNGESGFYQREVGFYRHLASSALIQTPRCFHASHDRERGEFILVLEDLAPATQGDQLAGVTVEQALVVVKEAAKLHASHWEDPAVDALPWVSGSSAAPVAPTTGAIPGMWRGFRDRYALQIQPDALAIGEAFFAVFDTYQRGHDGPRCLIHNDFRPDNMMFATQDGGYPVAVVDWQTLGYGHGASDISYFLAGALAPASRRKHEADLLDEYYRQLTAHGVKNYAWQQLIHDYSWHSFQLFMSAVVGAMVVRRTARGDDMFLVMLHGATDQIITSNALTLLET